MIRQLALAGALVVGVPVGAIEPVGSERNALLQIANQMDRAWTAGDADANAKLFAEMATARFSDDPLGEGREAILGQFRSFFTNRPAGLRHVTNIERIEWLRPDLAMWDAEVRVERLQAAGNWITLTRIRNVTVLVRQPEGWRIRSVRAFPVG